MREGFLARYEGDAQLIVHLQSLEVCTFEPLLLQVPADWPTNEPLHVPVHQVSSQLQTTALPFHSLEESKYLHSRLAHHRHVAGHTATPLKPMTSMKSLPRGSATMYDTSMNTAMSVWSSDVRCWTVWVVGLVSFAVWSQALVWLDASCSICRAVLAWRMVVWRQALGYSSSLDQGPERILSCTRKLRNFSALLLCWFVVFRAQFAGGSGFPRSLARPTLRGHRSDGYSSQLRRSFPYFPRIGRIAAVPRGVLGSMWTTTGRGWSVSCGVGRVRQMVIVC